MAQIHAKKNARIRQRLTEAPQLPKALAKRDFPLILGHSIQRAKAR
jgi:hypothetical protein